MKIPVVTNVTAEYILDKSNSKGLIDKAGKQSGFVGKFH